MRILLPPSEAKNAGGSGIPLASRRRDVALRAARAEVFAALSRLLDSVDPESAAMALRLPPAAASQALAANADVSHSRTMAAIDDGLQPTPLVVVYSLRPHGGCGGPNNLHLPSSTAADEAANSFHHYRPASRVHVHNV